MSKPQKKELKIPHPYIIIFTIILISAILTWILPSGSFERVLNEEVGRELVVPGSYTSVPGNPVGPWELLQCIYEGFVGSADISFFLLFACGYGGDFDAERYPQFPGGYNPAPYERERLSAHPHFYQRFCHWRCYFWYARGSLGLYPSVCCHCSIAGV